MTAQKRSKYAAIMLTHIFVPVAVETQKLVNFKGLRSLDQIGNRLSAITRYPQEATFLYQRLSVIVQHFSMIAFHGSFMSETDIEVLPLQTLFLSLDFNPRDLYYQGYLKRNKNYNNNNDKNNNNNNNCNNLLWNFVQT